MPDSSPPLPAATVTNNAASGGSSLLGGVVSALPLVGSVASSILQGAQNKKPQICGSMYDRQRSDSLSDLANQNEYNSPSSQMDRLRKAGLNPNLVYGSGNAVTASGTARSSNAPSADGRAPQIDLAGALQGLMAHFDMEMKEAQIDNLKTQNTVLQNDAVLKAVNAAKGETEINANNARLPYIKSLSESDLSYKQASTNKVLADTDFTLNQNERNALTTSQNLEKGVQQILLLRLQAANTAAERMRIQSQINNINSDTKLKTLSAQMQEKGIMPSDNIFIRAGAKIVDSGFLTPQKGSYLDKWFGVGK